MDNLEHRTTREDGTSGRIRSIQRVLATILAMNLIIALLKLCYGIYSKTTSMQAAGIDSLFDSVGNIIGLVGMAMASRPADYGHPYGHAKFETFASVAIGAMLVIASWNIGSQAVADLMSGSGAPEVTYISFLIMGFTLAFNLTITTWEHRQSKKLESEILAADARHTMADAIVTIGVFIGLIFIDLGYEIFDPIMSIIVAMVILYTAFGVFKQANATLADSARIPASDIIACAQKVPGVHECHEVRTRGTEAEVYVDLHLLVEPTMTVADAHEVAKTVERNLRTRYPQIRDAVIHVEPDTPVERAEAILESEGIEETDAPTAKADR